MALSPEQYQEFLSQLRGGSEAAPVVTTASAGPALAEPVAPVEPGVPGAGTMKERIERAKALQADNAAIAKEKEAVDTRVAAKQAASANLLTPANRATMMGLNPEIVKRLEEGSYNKEDVSTTIKATKYEKPTVGQGLAFTAKKMVGKATGAFGEESVFAGEEIGDSLADLLRGQPEEIDIIPLIGDSLGASLDVISLGKGKVILGGLKSFGGRASVKAAATEAFKKGGPRALKAFMTKTFGKIPKGEIAQQSVIGAGMGLSDAMVEGDNIVGTVGKIGFGATMGAISGKVSNKLTQTEADVIKNKAAKTLELLSPKVSKKVRQQALSEGRIVEPATRLGRMLKSAEILPEKDVNEAAILLAKEVPDLSNRPQEAILQINKAVGKVDDELMPQIDKIRFNQDDIVSAESMADRVYKSFELDDVNFDANKGAYNRGRKQFARSMEQLGKKEPLAPEIRAQRVELDQSVAKTVKNSTPQQRAANPTLELKYNIWQANREIMNDMLVKVADRGGSDAVKTSLKKMSLMLKARGNIIDNADLSKSFIEKNRRLLLNSGLTVVGLGGLGAIFGDK